MLEFTSRVGDEPWFFVADTGTEGGAATLLDASGVTTECVETQITSDEREWPDGTLAHGLGFKVPAPFTEVGDNVLTVIQDDATTSYLIHVEEKES